MDMGKSMSRVAASCWRRFSSDVHPIAIGFDRIEIYFSAKIIFAVSGKARITICLG